MFLESEFFSKASRITGITKLELQKYTEQAQRHAMAGKTFSKFKNGFKRAKFCGKSKIEKIAFA